MAEMRRRVRGRRVVPLPRDRAAQRATGLGQVQAEIGDKRSPRRQPLLDRQQRGRHVEQGAQQVYEARLLRHLAHSREPGG